MGLVKTASEIEIMAEAGHRLARVLKVVASAAHAGVRTKDLDSHALELIEAVGSKPAFLGYKPNGAKRAYPATICTSVNDVVVHGTPGDYKLKNGDVVGLDLGLIYKGFYVDAAVTVPVGKVSPEARKLIAATEEAMYAGIASARAGNHLGDVGHAIESVVKKNKLSVVQSLTGHGVGRELHEEPSVFNFGRPGQGEKLEVGMVIAIEPMVAAGSGKVKQIKDDSYATADGSLAAHFEHTVAITENGPRILTQA